MARPKSATGVREDQEHPADRLKFAKENFEEEMDDVGDIEEGKIAEK